MRTQHHLKDSTLLAYAAETLPGALTVAAASHLAWCRECRRAATARTRERPEPTGATALPLATARRGQTALKARHRRSPAVAGLAEPDMADVGLPMPLATLLDGRALEDVAWRKVLPGVAVCELALPPGVAGQLRLVRMMPGRALPSHGHGGGELSLVLRGAYRDEHDRYTIGDIADLDSSAVHRPVAEDAEPCICLMAAEAPARFQSWLGSLWQRLFGL